MTNIIPTNMTLTATYNNVEEREHYNEKNRFGAKNRKKKFYRPYPLIVTPTSHDRSVVVERYRFQVVIDHTERLGSLVR